jgi:cytochrome c oxidase subunit 3
MATETVAKHEHTHSKPSWKGGESPFGVSYGKVMMWYFLLSDAFTFAGFLIAYGALRFTSDVWPLPDFVFEKIPFYSGKAPLIFVTFMTFVLIVSSVTMVRAVQEGHRENKRGVLYWMLLTILGGGVFLSCQAWEWTNLIATENMTIHQNPFSRHTEDGVYTDKEGGAFKTGDSYLIHSHTNHETGAFELAPRPYKTATGEEKVQQKGPVAFGGIFFFVTGFHGFHVFSGLVFLAIIAMNVASGVYAARKNGYEMVEKIGLYWHFVDLVWVFVFLVFYLL